MFSFFVIFRCCWFCEGNIQSNFQLIATRLSDSPDGRQAGCVQISVGEWMNVKYFNASFVWMRKFHYLPSPFIFTVKIWGKMLYKVRFESIIDFKLYEWCKTVVMNDSQQGIIYLVCSVWWNQIIIAVKRVVTSRCECDLEMMIILCFATLLNLYF